MSGTKPIRNKALLLLSFHTGRSSQPVNSIKPILNMALLSFNTGGSSCGGVPSRHPDELLPLCLDACTQALEPRSSRKISLPHPFRMCL